MRKVYYFLLFVCLPLLSQAQIPNLGMESWRTSTTGDSTPVSIEVPNFWYSSDSVIISLGQTPLAYSYLHTQDTDYHRQVFQESVITHSGQHSAKLMTRREGTYYIPGIIANATSSFNLVYYAPYLSGVQFSGGSGVDVKPVSVSAWVKYFPGKDSTGNTGLDSGKMSIQALAHISGIDSVIGTADLIIVPDTGWTQITAYISYINQIYPIDTIRLAFASSNNATGLDSSTLYIDDISMTSIPNPPPVIQHTGVGIVAANDLIDIYPNPAAGLLFIDVPLQNEMICKIYALSGRSVVSAVLNGGRNQLDISALADGLYFYDICESNGMVMQRGKVVISK